MRSFGALATARARSGWVGGLRLRRALTRSARCRMSPMVLGAGHSMSGCSSARRTGILRGPIWGKRRRKGDDLGGDIVRCPMRDVDRRARPILQPGSAVGIVARQPLVSNTAADAAAGRQLGDGVEPAEVGLDESHPFVHRTGLLPWHDTPSLHVGKCYPCSRSVLLPMFPLCTVAAADARPFADRKSTRLNSSHQLTSYAVF